MVGTAISAGIGLYSASKQASASKKAARTEAKSADEASQVQKDMYNQTRQDQMPWLKSGTAALNTMDWLMGLTPKAGQAAPPVDAKGQPIPAGSTTAAVAPTTNFTGGPYEGPYDPNEGKNTSLGAYGSLSKAFGLSDFYEDPGYQFALQQGQKSIQASAAANGGLFSGATGKAMQTYGQNTAAGQYQQAFERYNANQSNLFNRLSSVAGTGQTSATTLGNVGQNTANNIGNNMTSAGTATAAGQMGSANAWSTGLQNFNNTLQQSPTYQKLTGTGAYGPITWN